MPSAKSNNKHSKGKAHGFEIKTKQPPPPVLRAPCLAAGSRARSVLGGTDKTKPGGYNSVTAGKKSLLSVGVGADVSPTTANVHSNFKLFLLGPGDIDDADSLNGPAMLDLLELIRQRRKVRIESEPSFPNSVTIYGDSHQSICAAHRDISGFIQHLRLPGHNQAFMVQSSNDQHKRIRLTKDVHHPELSRPSFRDDPSYVKVESAGSDNLLKEATAFRQKFALFTKTLRTIPIGLHMQVHLGKFLVSTQDGDSVVNAGGAAAELHSAVANPTIKDSVVFDRRIGSLMAFRAFQKLIFKAKDAFYPLSSVVERLEDVQPRQFLVGVMESFRFELEIGPPGSAPDGSSAKLSGLRVFQTFGSEGKVGLTVACPTHHVDWKLETIPELQPGDIPEIIKDYLRCLTVVHSKTLHEFPTPILRSTSNKEYRVKQLYGKTTWTVGCKGTQYKLELSLYHRFSKPFPGLANQEQTLTGISMWSTSWDEVLRPPAASDSSRSLSEDLNDLFRPGIVPGEERDGVITFLELLQQIIRFWDRVSDRSTPATIPNTPDSLGIQDNSKTDCGIPEAALGKQNCSIVDLISEQNASVGVADMIGSQVEDLIVFD